jgi:hypothetical protein
MRFARKPRAGICSLESHRAYSNLRRQCIACRSFRGGAIAKELWGTKRDSFGRRDATRHETGARAGPDSHRYQISGSTEKATEQTTIARSAKKCRLSSRSMAASARTGMAFQGLIRAANSGLSTVIAGDGTLLRKLGPWEAKGRPIGAPYDYASLRQRPMQWRAQRSVGSRCAAGIFKLLP